MIGSRYFIIGSKIWQANSFPVQAERSVQEKKFLPILFDAGKDR